MRSGICGYRIRYFADGTDLLVYCQLVYHLPWIGSKTVHYLLPSVLLLETAEVLLLGKAAVMAQDWLTKRKNERK